MSIIAQAEVLIDLHDKIQELEAKLKELKAKKTAQEGEVLASMAEEGVQSFKLKSGRSVHIRRDIYASAVNQEALVKAMQDLGNGAMCKTSVNAASLASWVREHERKEDSETMAQETVLDSGVFDLPDTIKPLIKITEKYKVIPKK